MSDTLHKLLDAIEQLKAACDSAWSEDIQIVMMKDVFELCAKLREEMSK